MLRVAMLFVRSRAVAEEVVQDTWVGVLDGIGRFEGRSSFKTWLFRILTNTAKTRGERESRTTPVSFLSDSELEPGVRSVDPDRFLPDGDRWAGWWASSPLRFDEQPESRLLSSETLAIVRRVVEELPEAQKAVIAMRGPRWVQLRGGLREPRHQRGQSARPAPSRPYEGAPGARGSPGRGDGLRLDADWRASVTATVRGSSAERLRTESMPDR